MTSYIDRDAARAIDEDYEEEEVYDDALGEPESETADNKVNANGVRSAHGNHWFDRFFQFVRTRKSITTHGKTLG